MGNRTSKSKDALVQLHEGNCLAYAIEAIGISNKNTNLSLTDYPLYVYMVSIPEPYNSHILAHRLETENQRIVAQYGEPLYIGLAYYEQPAQQLASPRHIGDERTPQQIGIVVQGRDSEDFEWIKEALERVHGENHPLDYPNAPQIVDILPVIVPYQPINRTKEYTTYAICKPDRIRGFHRHYTRLFTAPYTNDQTDTPLTENDINQMVVNEGVYPKYRRQGKSITTMDSLKRYTVRFNASEHIKEDKRQLAFDALPGLLQDLHVFNMDRNQPEYYRPVYRVSNELHQDIYTQEAVEVAPSNNNEDGGVALESPPEIQTVRTRETHQEKGVFQLYGVGAIHPLIEEHGLEITVPITYQNQPTSVTVVGHIEDVSELIPDEPYDKELSEQYGTDIRLEM